MRMANDGTPQWGALGQQPQDGQQPPAPGQQPQYGQPQYGQPQYGQPQYGQPQYGQPQQPGQPYPMYQPGPPIPLGPDGAPPLWAPWYGIGFLDAFLRFFKKYARFDGRASRGEYWYWVLANAIITLVLFGAFYAILITSIVANTRVDEYGSPVGDAAPSPVAFIFLGLWFLWWLATLVPNIALGWRRVHDAGLPGPVWLVGMFVSVAAIVLGCLGPNPTGAQYDRPDLG
jgi:uncharacterized membrane protein YhaH (DUF805 family)